MSPRSEVEVTIGYPAGARGPALGIEDLAAEIALRASGGEAKKGATASG